MKPRAIPRAALVLWVILLTGLHCDNNQAPPGDLFGRWNWVWSTGGIAGQTLTPATEGYTQALDLERSQAYTLYQADTVWSAGTFTLATEDSLRIIRYKRTTGQAWFDQQVHRPHPDTLVLVDHHCADCFVRTFTRIN